MTYQPSRAFLASATSDVSDRLIKRCIDLTVSKHDGLDKEEMLQTYLTYKEEVNNLFENGTVFQIESFVAYFQLQNYNIIGKQECDVDSPFPEDDLTAHPVYYWYNITFLMNLVEYIFENDYPERLTDFQWLCGLTKYSTLVRWYLTDGYYFDTSSAFHGINLTLFTKCLAEFPEGADVLVQNHCYNLHTVSTLLFCEDGLTHLQRYLPLMRFDKQTLRSIYHLSAYFGRYNEWNFIRKAYSKVLENNAMFFSVEQCFTL